MTNVIDFGYAQSEEGIADTAAISCGAVCETDKNVLVKKCQANGMNGNSDASTVHRIPHGRRRDARES